MALFPRYLIFGLLFVFPAAQAQLPHGGKPFPFSTLKSALRPIILNSFDLQKAIDESLSSESVSGKKPFKFAWNYSLDFSPENSGVWTETASGTRIWRLHLVSKGAYSLNVDFSQYQLKQGCMVFIYPPSQDYFLGGFNHLNNNSSNTLPSTFVPGDEIVIELQTDPGITDYGSLRIGSLAHAYIDVFNRKDGYFGRSGNCNVNIKCSEDKDVQLIKRAVCRIIFKTGASTETCTGTLVNNVKEDTIPYLLTANHCIRFAGQANSAVFYFDYESDSCGSRDDTTFYSLAGSTILATSDSIDFSLLRLSESPPETYKPYFAGWSLSTNPPTHAFCIHHPQGDVKKISIENDAITAEYQNPIPSNLSWLTKMSVPEAFWRVIKWDTGTTEGGSSGSPLFNQDKLIVGNLTGGEAKCTNSVNDYFSKISMAWDHYPVSSKQLKYWLNPESKNIQFLKGFNPFGEKDTSSIDTIEFAERFVIFPNPTTGITTFETDSLDTSGGILAIYSLTGEKMAQFVILNNQRMTFDVSFLDQGLYIMEFSKGSIQKRKRLMIIKQQK